MSGGTSPGTASPGSLGARGVQVGDLKRMNARLVLASLRAEGASTGPELADRLAMTKPTVAAALRLLASANLVTSVGVRVGHVGRSPEVWQINASAGTVLAIDVGSHYVQASLATLDGTIVGRGGGAIDDGSAPAVLLSAVDNACAAARAEAVAHAKISRTTSIRHTWTVIGVPGVVDPETLRVSLVPNLPALADPAVAVGLRARFGDAVELQKDVYLAARGELEARRGADDDFVLLTIGHGIGAALVRDGRPVVGAGGFAGEIAYLPLAPQAVASPSETRVAPLEHAASLDALLAAATSAGIPVQSVDELFAVADNEDGPAGAAARAAIRAEAEIIAYALCAVVISANPARVVLSGSIALAGGLSFCRAVSSALGALLPFSAPPIEIAHTGPEATLVGASSVAVEQAWDILAVGIDAGE